MSDKEHLIGKSNSIVEMKNSMAIKKFAASNKNVRNSLNATQTFIQTNQKADLNNLISRNNNNSVLQRDSSLI